jgi:hypothetical protein
LARDSLFGERIVWTGRPKVIAPSPFQRAISWVLFSIAAIATLFALVVALVVKESPAASLLLGFWCAGLGLAARQLPCWLLARTRYVVTEQHVIAYVGPLSRTIERKAISFARLYWDESEPKYGDLELVRAVPTGALRRRLMLRLQSIAAPDRVWAIVRGAEDVAPRGMGDQPLAQRLDRGEHVVWSARPRQRMRRLLPHGSRQWSLLAVAAMLFAAVVRMLLNALPALSKVHEALPGRSLPFVALSIGVVGAIVLVFGIACYILWDGVLRQAFLTGETRYLITNKRVLIQRGVEELHLDRDKIVHVIDTPAGGGLHDVFMVIDGPRARALAASGAFGEIDRSPHLRPVFEAVEDAEGASRILTAAPELPRAA